MRHPVSLSKAWPRFDHTGWRIDYHLATAPLAERVTAYRIDRAPSWDTRWSDHAPVVVDYTIGG